MTRSRTFRLATLTVSNALLPAAVLIFAFGFFPYKPLLPGLATFEDVQETDIWGHEQPEAIFDRVVFMVVDALRSDFVFGHNSGFEFTQSLIRDGAAIPFTAHATPPTVTMPRVKALTTGSVPSFADLIFNLDESGSGSTLATQDTWLAQIKAKGGKLVFYGDDTWLRLFPGDFFERADGTSSFFVSDFTEVDNNVTRHVPDELEKSDWNAMIMHYLGLDHIGHKTGPNGPNMLPKQREMDAIVKQIYEAMEAKERHANTLLVLAGDHGMNAGGNHGGSGPGETEPALLFASPKLKSRRNLVKYEWPTTPKKGTEFHYYRKIEQSDIVPTLAGLMQLPTPKNSLGVFIEEFTGLWDEPAKATQILHQVGKRMLHIVKAAYGADSIANKIGWWLSTFAQDAEIGVEIHTCVDVDSDDRKLACLWARAEHAVRSTLQNRPTWDPVDTTLLAFLTEAQDFLSNAASSYHIPYMVAGMIVTTAALAIDILSLPSVWPPSTAGVFFCLTSLLYGIMMFASSYVEEEQHLWYWLSPAWMALLTAVSVTRSRNTRQRLRLATAGVVLLAVHRIAIRWNQTGQKHAGEPDSVHTFFHEHHRLMWLLVLATYGYNCVMLTLRTFRDLIPQEIGAVAALLLIAPTVIFKLNFTQADAPELVQGLAYTIRAASEPYSLVLQAQITFALLTIAAVIVITLAVGLARGSAITGPNGPAVNVTLSERLHYLFTIFLMTQSRAPSIPPFLGLEAQYLALRWLLSSAEQPRLGSGSKKRNAIINTTELATSILLLSHVYFFCMGGSNSISSVDLSNAYNGVGDYNIVAVGVLLFASNWTGSLWWCSAAVLLTFSKPDPKPATAVKGIRSWVEEERRRLQQDATKAEAESKYAETSTLHWLDYVYSMTAFIAVSLLAVMAACTALRTHLFIWTVFSPKFLYAMAWSVGWHIVVNIGLGSLLRWVGQIA